MKIIIIADNTFSDFDNVFLRGTGAHKIATFLRSNTWQTEVVDFILRWSLEEFQILCRKLVNHDTLMLGVSSNLFTDRSSLNDKLIWFKKEYPHIPIVVGGNNLLSREISPADYFVEGYGESAMLTLLDYLSGKITKQQVKWSTFTDKVDLIDATKDYPYNDTNDLTIRYQPSDFIQAHETLAIETSRGCIFKCRFCTYPLLGKKKTDYFRHHSNIRDELLYNYETYGIKNYMIAEDTFNDSVEKLENLANAIEKLSFQPQFVSYIRFDLILSQPHTLNLLRQIGLRAAFFGIETFNGDDGKLVRKGKSSEKIKDGLLWWANNAKDIATHVSMIVGLPNSSEEQAWKDKEWLASSGISWYTWNPLYFTDVTRTIHTSDFSHNYRNYGYEIMTKNEIQNILAEEDKKREKSPSSKFFDYNLKTKRHRMTYWKHNKNGMNFFKAAVLCDRLNNASKTRRLGGYHVFTHASLGYDINDVMKWGYYDVQPHVPEEKIKSKTQKLIADYIGKKLKHNYKNIDI